MGLWITPGADGADPIVEAVVEGRLSAPVMGGSGGMAVTESEALAALHRVFGYEAFRGEQEAVIEHVVTGGDAVVLMPTGGGKSLCYQIPALVRPGTGSSSPR
ncbi:hypothetical protein SHKM778_07420 [Streptomyces sp. KM77-8]|uniref:DNA 3'-5' helicase n=1 Tax=Streptomyces haneummycinicus TaxID=3074435 RepID=A0AAT9HAF7_9ACTN